MGAYLGEFLGDIFSLTFEQFQFQTGRSEIEQRSSKSTNQSFQF